METVALEIPLELTSSASIQLSERYTEVSDEQKTGRPLHRH